MRVGGTNGALKFTFDILMLETYGDRLPVTRPFDQSIYYTIHTFRNENAFPSGRGRGMARSSARKSTFSRSKAWRVSNNLNFPRCVPFVTRQIADDRRMFDWAIDNVSSKDREKSRFDARFITLPLRQPP